MFWREQGPGDEIVVCFTGILDATSARAVRQFLHVDEPGEVVLDFSLASEVDYYGLSVLVTEIAQSKRNVLLRGLHVNQVRMLRYFGLDPVQFGITESQQLDVG